MRSGIGLIAILFAGLLLPAAAQGAIIVPAGLNPGDTYQLAFVTSTTTAATSSDIATYNAIVQSAAANAGMGSLVWHVIGSTLTVDARDNALVAAPVYNMGGELVATGYADFWDGTHTTGVGIDFNENNVGRNTNVWTGTDASGTSGGGGDALGESTPNWGESTFSSVGWVAHGGNTNTVLYSLYALSPVLTVVPEPAAAGLLAVAALALLKRR